MPKHDTQSGLLPVNDPPLNDYQAAKVEGIAIIMAEHLYAQPMTSEQDEADDDSNWNNTSEDNKRIFRSCALEVYRNLDRP